MMVFWVICVHVCRNCNRMCYDMDAGLKTYSCLYDNNVITVLLLLLSGFETPLNKVYHSAYESFE